MERASRKGTSSEEGIQGSYLRHEDLVAGNIRSRRSIPQCEYCLTRSRCGLQAERTGQGFRESADIEATGEHKERKKSLVWRVGSESRLQLQKIPRSRPLVRETRSKHCWRLRMERSVHFKPEHTILFTSNSQLRELDQVQTTSFGGIEDIGNART